MFFIAFRPSWHCRPNTGTHGQRRGITQPQNSVVVASPSILSDILLYKDMNYAFKTQIVDLIDVSLLPDYVVQAFDTITAEIFMQLLSYIIIITSSSSIDFPAVVFLHFIYLKPLHNAISTHPLMTVATSIAHIFSVGHIRQLT